MDGVLIDSHPVHIEAWSELLRRLNRPLGLGEIDFILNGAKRDEILRHFLGELSRAQLEAYGRMKEELFRERMDRVRAVPGVDTLLLELRQAAIPCAVATSAARTRTRNMLSHLGLLQEFSAIVTGDDVSNGKPDPALFQMAATRLSTDPRQILVVEDALAGVCAAKAAGMKCLALGPHVRHRQFLQAGADAVAPDLTSIDLVSLQELF
jgi:beta-phosphoglucomutase